MNLIKYEQGNFRVKQNHKSNELNKHENISSNNCGIHTFLSVANETFFKIDHILGHKAENHKKMK
jgi:hypothetical protein